MLHYIIGRIPLKRSEEDIALDMPPSHAARSAARAFTPSAWPPGRRRFPRARRSPSRGASNIVVRGLKCTSKSSGGQPVLTRSALDCSVSMLRANVLVLISAGPIAAALGWAYSLRWGAP